MKKSLQMIADILMLRDGAFEEFKSRPGVFGRGLLILVVIALVVGVINSAVALASGLRPISLETERQRAKQQFTQEFERYAASFDLTPEIAEMVKTYAESGIDIGFDIAALPTRLAAPTGTIFRSIGAALSWPFSYLSGWLFYSLLVLLAAKILGGQAGLKSMLGCTALSSIPYLLNILGPVPWLGRLVAVAAFLWGALIFIKATAVANRMTTERGFLAVVLPWAVALALVLIAIPTILLSIILFSR